MNQRIVLRIGKVCCIPGAGAGQRCLKEDVRHAAMAEICDAHFRVEPRRLAGHRISAAGPLIHDVQRDVTADLLDGVLDKYRVFLDFQEFLVGQRRLEAGGHARRFHQLLGLCNVDLALRNAGVGRRIDRHEEAVIADLGFALQQPRDQLGPVQTEGDGLPHPLVLEGLHVGAHVNLAMHGRLCADGVDAGIAEQSDGLQDRDLLDDVDLSGLQRKNLRLVIVVERDLDPVGQGRRAPVVGIAHEGGADFRRVLLQLEGPGADHRRFKVFRHLGGYDHRIVVVG